MVGLSEGDFWFDLPSEIQEAIKRSKGELDRGEGIPHKRVMSEVKRFD